MRQCYLDSWWFPCVYTYVKFKLVYAKDYGVPQNRPRILIIGIKRKFLKKKNISPDALEGGFLPNPTNDYPNLEDVLSDLIDL